MSISTTLLPPSPHVWDQVAKLICDAYAGGATGEVASRNAIALSDCRVVLPGVAHIAPLRRALAAQMPPTFIAPRMSTLSGWLALSAPATTFASNSARMMTLYAQLREHGWLKKMFSARRNLELLPLAQTLITLFDELSAALLPRMQSDIGCDEAAWESALAQLSPPARKLLSEESQLVWALWKGQLDQDDPVARRVAALNELAEQASHPLIWISAHAPTPMEQCFLDMWSMAADVQLITLDWSRDATPPLFAAAWPEILASGGQLAVSFKVVEAPAEPQLYCAANLEDEAQHGANTVFEWLRSGCSCIAIIAQDRVVARRMRALLERAQVQVADETGWKLSTTRAAATLIALLELASSRGDSVALLDLIKSPFVFANDAQRQDMLLCIEEVIRRENILGGWDKLHRTMVRHVHAQRTLQHIEKQVSALSGKRTLAAWSQTTSHVLQQLGIQGAFLQDHAGRQVLAQLEQITFGSGEITQAFSFHEWRALINMQLEKAPFVPVSPDRRVIMLQLAGAPLRQFDAVLMVGADGDHFPSRTTETLFFANAVRRELGLTTREQRECSQLREFAEMLCANERVVLSWQAHKNGEPNAASAWLLRLNLARAHAGLDALKQHVIAAHREWLNATPISAPFPAAPDLVPRTLSASGYGSLVACPYQFFATRMLGLSELDDLSDMPEKRDYGNWLHLALKQFHERVRDEQVPNGEREQLLRAVSADIFQQEIGKNGAALGWYVRWQALIPEYVEWCASREADGWHFLSAEEWREVELHWPGGTLTLRGRIDRIDVHTSGERAVLDYKTKKAPDLKKRIADGEDHQLPFYGLLEKQQVQSGVYVPLDGGASKGAPEAEDFEQWQVMLKTRIEQAWSAMAAGAPLPATGAESACQYCDVRGVCRKGAW